MSETAAMRRLRSAVEACTRAQIEEAEAIADVAAEHEWTAGDAFDVVGTRPVRIGADGTALLEEFLPLEVAALKGISVAAATWLIRDIVNLKARHPLLWAQTRRGLVPVYRARLLVQEAARFGLSLEESQDLDAELAPKLPALPWRRVLQLARGIIARVASDKVEQFAAESRAARFVRKLPTDDPLVGYLSCRVDTRDAVFFDGTVARIADILAARGDTDPLDIRRARALGILATPARAALMLAEAAGHVSDVESTDPRLLPETTMYVHVAEETLLGGRGTARVEGIGPLAATMLKFLVGDTRIRVTPVIRPYADVAVDSYEIPDRIRRQVLLRDTYEVFPFSARSARGADLDHTQPYRAGGKKQTRTGNLGSLSRKAHRGKTHGGWELEQPKPGIFWWTSPAGNRYRVGPHGTRRVFRNPGARFIDEYLWDSDHQRRPEDDPSP